MCIFKVEQNFGFWGSNQKSENWGPVLSLIDQMISVVVIAKAKPSRDKIF